MFQDEFLHLEFVFSFLVIESCTKCESREEVLAKAKPNNIPTSDKNNFAFYHINKMTFLVNDSSVEVFNLTNKNNTYYPHPYSYEGSCNNFPEKDEQNSFVYSSTSQILPNIISWQKTFVGQTNFDINFSGYIPNFNVNSSVVYRGIGTMGGLPFRLSDFLKLDSIKTTFDSIYYNVYLFRSPNDTIYYSPTKGIVKMIFYDNFKFELIKAE